MRDRGAADARWLALAAAAALHVGLLVSDRPAALPGRPVSQAVHPGRPGPVRFSMRWMAPSDAARPDDTRPRDAARVTAQAHPARPETARDHATPAGSADPADPAGPARVTTDHGPSDLRTPPEAIRSPTDTVAGPRGDFGLDDYLPRAALSLAPVARSTVLIDYPDGAPAGHFETTLTLYIDEQGQVRHVRAQDDSALPPPLLDAAVQTFLATRFSPGELHGQPVRTRIRIEVEFRADAPPRPVSTE